MTIWEGIEIDEAHTISPTMQPVTTLGLHCKFCGDYWRFEKKADMEAMKHGGCVNCVKARRIGAVYGIARPKYE